VTHNLHHQWCPNGKIKLEQIFENRI